MGEVSIWQWAITDDLDAVFAQLVAADDAGCLRMAVEGWAGLRLQVMAKEAEAKMREMGLPEEELATMLKGLEAMLAEEDDWAEAMTAEGAPEVGLATSHMFFEDPHASIEYEDRERQVAELFGAYKAAASKALGQPGRSVVEACGVTLEAFFDAEDSEALMDTGMTAGTWIWEADGVVYALNQFQEDKELPIDVTFARMTANAFAAVKDAVTRA